MNNLNLFYYHHIRRHDIDINVLENKHWDFMNILFFFHLSFTYFSIHWQIFLLIIVFMVFIKLWFSISLELSNYKINWSTAVSGREQKAQAWVPLNGEVTGEVGISLWEINKSTGRNVMVTKCRAETDFRIKSALVATFIW